MCCAVLLALYPIDAPLVHAQTTATVPSVDPHVPQGRPTPNVIVESLKRAQSHQGITAWWLGNSGFAVQMNENIVLTDPVIELARDSEPLLSEMGWRKQGPGEWLQPVWQCEQIVPLRFRLPMLAREVPKCDVVMVSHAHEDHGASKTLHVLGRQTTAHFCGPLDMKQKFLDVGIPEDRIHLGLPGHREKVAGLNIEWTYAVHGPPTYSCGFLIDQDHERVFYTGDQSTMDPHKDFPHIMDFRDIDLLIMPIPYLRGNKGPMLANSTDASFVLPSHFNTYDIPGEQPHTSWMGGNPEDWRQYMHHPDRLIRLLQGQALHIEEEQGSIITNPNPRQLREQAWPAYGKITIDGDLNDWQRARWTIKLRPRILTHWGTDTARCAVLWDEENLYIGFDVNDAEVRGTVKQRDGSTFSDDCVEVNIDPHGDRPERLEKNDYIYTLNVLNTMSDASGPGEDKTWNSEVRHAVVRRGSGYSAEMAIPWRDLGVEPRVGMRIPIDFIVGDRDLNREEGETDYYYDWAELRSPQTPVNWGEIELVGRAR